MTGTQPTKAASKGKQQATRHSARHQVAGECPHTRATGFVTPNASAQSDARGRHVALRRCQTAGARGALAGSCLPERLRQSRGWDSKGLRTSSRPATELQDCGLVSEDVLFGCKADLFDVILL